jgi:hypothetical protein
VPTARGGAWHPQLVARVLERSRVSRETGGPKAAALSGAQGFITLEHALGAEFECLTEPDHTLEARPAFQQ